eukprot:GHRQ01023273.1.p1 GENE.GHRQ01023273.1~~GHRQ01023273.1.p1  ORF type:complete len:252 (+),score=88.80 GHRQ01023273.1:841-1596(+)
MCVFPVLAKAHCDLQPDRCCSCFASAALPASASAVTNTPTCCHTPHPHLLPGPHLLWRQVTSEHNEDCRRLLRLMGVPVIDAPSEAEAQCAAMAREGVVYGAATEDMDCLTFGCPTLIRHLMAPASQNAAIQEFSLPVLLEELGLSMQQFIELCILCGCDYASNIRGIGAVRALSLIKQHGSVEAVLASLDPAKYPLPEPYPYKEAAAFFAQPDVTHAEQLPPLKWSAPDVEGLIAFLVGAWWGSWPRAQG